MGTGPTRVQTSTGETVTKVCPEHGEYEARVIVGNIVSQCPGCEQDRKDKEEARKKREEAAKVQANLSRLLKQSCIPVRFTDRSFDNFATGGDDKQERQMESNLMAMRRYAEKWVTLGSKLGTSILMVGNPGTGKTHLALAVANHVIREHHEMALYTTVYRMVRAIKDTWRGGDTAEQAAIANFVEPALLVLDEVGVQWGSEAEQIILFEVLNRRYEERKPTILISNLDLKGVEEVIGERVVDRIFEDGGAVLAFTWPSYRRKK